MYAYTNRLSFNEYLPYIDVYMHMCRAVGTGQASQAMA